LQRMLMLTQFVQNMMTFLPTMNFCSINEMQNLKQIKFIR
jgi:hypothetical protein